LVTFLAGVDFENPLDFGQQTIEQPKVSTANADDDATVSGFNGV